MFKKILAVSLITLLLPIQVLAFQDVSKEDRNFEAISFLEDLEFFTDVNFSPDSAITRGELFEYIALLNNIGEAESNEEISGVSEYLRPLVGKFRELGIRTRIGEAGFEEDKPVNRVTALRMLMNYEGVFIPKQFDTENFKAELEGVPSEAYYSHIIAKALDLNLLNLVEGENYNPLAQFTREDLAVMLANMEIYKSRLAQAEGKLPEVIKLGYSESNLTFLTREQNQILLNVWNTIDEDYVDKSTVDKEELFYGMLEGMVASLDDPYSVFQSPEIHENFMQTLNDSLEGIGAVLEEDEAGHLIIVSPLNQSPAEKAGLLPGDWITAVDGLSTLAETMSESVNRIRGEAGTEVVLNVLRGGEELEFTITRAEIDLPSVTYEITSDDVAIVSMNSFGVGAITEFQEFLNEVDTSKLKGLILDLRNNPGGYVAAATDIADHFLADGDIILKTEDSNGYIEELRAYTEPSLSELKTIVLINQGSASASEILALALRENTDTLIMGQTSYGKGSVQEIVSYVDNSSLKLTTAHWLSPSGESINKVGIEPDVFIELTEEDMLAGRDAVMIEALGRF